MSKIDDLKNQHEKIKAEMKKLEEEIKKLKKNKDKWTPKYDEEYFFVDEAMDVICDVNQYSIEDEAIIKYKKTFKTEEEAQAFIGAHKEQILKYEFGIELFDTKI